MFRILNRLVLVLVVLACTACEDDRTPPHPSAPLSLTAETPAAQQLSAFIEALRTGERASVEALIRDHMAGFLQEIPINEHVTQLLAFYPNITRITFKEYTRNDPYAVEALFQNTETGEWLKLAIEVEKTPPHRIYLIGLEPASARE